MVPSLDLFNLWKENIRFKQWWTLSKKSKFRPAFGFLFQKKVGNATAESSNEARSIKSERFYKE